MDVKYTFRDLIVYLLTGFTCVCLFLLVKSEYIDIALNSKFLKDSDKILLFLFTILIPLLYIVGHIIQIFDLIISFYLARPLTKYRWNPQYNSFKYSIFRYLYFFTAASTVEYHTQKRCISHDDFNNQKYTLLIEGKYNSAEYYYLVRELFNGLRIFTFVFTVYLIFSKNTEFLTILIYILLYLIFWLKAYNSAKNYTYEITKVYSVLKKKST